ncbi:PilZ domain-containing protein [bacterium]|nr:PilZ domain-containing protein [bacterium]
MQNSADDNRRRFPRVTVDVSGFVYLSPDKSTPPVPCEIVDVSLGGAFLHCTAPIQIGQEILVEIHFEAQTLLEAKVIHPVDTQSARDAERSIVRWARGSSKSGIGVEFVKLSPTKQAFLQKFIAHFYNQTKT